MTAYHSPHTASGTHSPASHTPGMAVNMVGDMAVNVIAPNGSWVNVFDLETTFELKFEVRFRSCFLVEPTPSLTGDLALWCPALLRQRIPGCAWQVLHRIFHHRHQGTCHRLAQLHLSVVWLNVFLPAGSTVVANRHFRCVRDQLLLGCAVRQRAPLPCQRVPEP
jgi:hypothetical protein